MELDKDLHSIQEARDLVKKSNAAQKILEEFSQEKINLIVKSMADAAIENSEKLAKLAVEETNIGIFEHKVQKNLFASKTVYEFIKDLKTVGFIKELPEKKVYEIAEPMGVIVGIIPTTNPTSTIFHNALIAVKARNAIIFSPHPNAVKCSKAAADILNDAARNAGAPDDIVLCMETVTMEGTNTLMKHPDVNLILATGGTALVKAAYSSGTPAIGVGPGNVPAYIEKSADIKRAVENIIISKTFDNGVVCSSEQNIVVDREISNKVKETFKELGGYFLSDEEQKNIEKILFSSKGIPSIDIVGRSATFIAKRAGIDVPPNTKVLIAELKGVGPDFPLSKEKLSPVLAYYEVEDWLEGCELCIKILKFEGLGHTLVIHSNNEEVIKSFALKKPAFRILVNTGGSQGAIGLTTGLDPSMTLGCGAMGGGITSDNVTPYHLMNIKRLAYPLSELTLEEAKPQKEEENTIEKTVTEEKISPQEEENHLTDEEIEGIVKEFLKWRTGR